MIKKIRGGIYLLLFLAQTLGAEENNKIRVGTVVGLLTCHYNEYGATGLEYQLTRSFLQSVGREAQFKVYANRQAAVTALKAGELDMVAAFFHPTEEQRQDVLSTIPWHNSRLVFIQKMKGAEPIKSLEQKIQAPIKLPENSFYYQMVQSLNKDWPLEASDLSEENLILSVNAGHISYSVTSLEQFTTYRIFAPMLSKGLELEKKAEIRWLFAPGLDELRDQANDFLARLMLSGELKKKVAKALNGLAEKDFVTRRDFWKHVKTRLPKYIKYFQQAEAETGIDWRLLAAVGYQESHWRKNARSPTGVEGIMMLTKATAKQQGIKNRLDPKQSIIGGAKHLLWMEQRLPDDIQGEDLFWFTLAAYNIGHGHLLDARQLARWSKEDPSSWQVVKKYLPLLSKKRFYSKLKYGKARGKEPVIYVENIHYYYSLLVLWDNQRRGIDCSAEDQVDHLRLVRKN